MYYTTEHFCCGLERGRSKGIINPHKDAQMEKGNPSKREDYVKKHRCRASNKYFHLVFHTSIRKGICCVVSHRNLIIPMRRLPNYFIDFSSSVLRRFLTIITRAVLRIVIMPIGCLNTETSPSSYNYSRKMLFRILLRPRGRTETRGGIGEQTITIQ